MSKYKLIYFDVRGRAEISRLIFAAAGQEYEDKRIIEYTEPDYEKVLRMLTEAERIFTQEWLDYKKTKTPFGQLPLLEVDGQIIAQSKVIATFLARRFGLAGKNDVEEARAAMMAETAEEFFISHIYKIFREDDKQKQAAESKRYGSEILPSYLTMLEKQVGEKGFFVGDQLTYADIAFYYNSAYLPYINVELDWTKYPKLKAVIDNVLSNPGIAKWLKERPNNFF